MTKQIRSELILYSDGAFINVRASHKHEMLAVVNEFSQEFLAVLSKKLGDSEVFCSLEQIMGTQNSRFNTAANNDVLSEFLCSFIFPANTHM